MLTNPQEAERALVVWDSSKLIAMQETSSKIVALMNEVGRNSEDLPLGYIDTQVILEKAALMPLEELLRNPPGDAFIPLSYVEGFATTPEGVPFWERLDCEPLDYYNLFKAYRDMLYTKLHTNDPNTDKVRDTYHDIEHERSLRSLRSLYAVANRTYTNKQVIKAIHQMYHWTSRVKAFDAFRQRTIEATREFEMIRMQSAHGKAARSIFDLCMKFLEDHKDELNPKTALDWFQTATELERLALGLPKDKPAGEDNGAFIPSTLIQINQSSQQTIGTINQQVNSNGTKPREARILEVLDILRDSRAAEASLTSHVPADEEGEGEIVDVDL